MKGKKSGILSRLNQDSLVSLIPGFLEVCLEYGSIRRLRPGERVCAQGEMLDELIIPIFGSIRMHRGSAQEDREFGILQESRSLGLRQILFNEPTPFVATADGDCQVLSLPIARFLSHLKRHPDIANYLKLMVSSAGIRYFREMLAAKSLSIESVCAIFSAIELEPIVLERGDELDMSDPSIWFVTSGMLKVGKVALSEGAFFGAEALSAPYEYSYQVTAKERVVLYRAKLKKLRAHLKRFNLVDELILSSRARLKPKSIAKLPKWDSTELPGRSLAGAEIEKTGYMVDWTQIRFGTAKANNSFDTIHNFIMFLEHPVQESSIELDLRLKGISYASLALSLERFGYICRASRGKFKDLARLQRPALVGYGPRLALLLKAQHDRCWLIDPIQGHLSVDREEFRKYWNGEVFCVESAVSDWVPDSPTKPFLIVFGTFATALPHLLSRSGIQILSLALSAIAPVLAGYLVQRLSQDAPFEEMLKLSLAGFSLFIISSLLRMSGSFVDIELQQRFDYRLRAMFFRMVTRLKNGAKVTLGQLTTYEDEFLNVAHFCLNGATHLVFDVVAILLFSAMLATYDIRFPAIGIGLLALLVSIRLAVSAPLRAQFEKQIEASAKVRQLASETIGAMGTIKAAGAETMSRHSLENAHLTGWKLRIRTGILQIGIESILQIFSVAAIALTFFVGVHLYFEGVIGVGEVMVVNALMMSLLGHLNILADQIGNFEHVRASARKLGEFFRLPSDTGKEQVASDLNVTLSGHIEFEGVSFAYPGSARPIFNDLRFSIYPNQIVAVVGKSGTGKSTLAKLLSGEVQPTSGRIFLDGYDVNFLSSECKRREIGMVLQKNELFSGTVVENISFGSDSPVPEKVDDAIKLSASGRFIGELPREADHFLAEGGMGLSGGEKQRIAIARTIYGSPQIYVFDEATSALDANSEAEVVANMRKFLAGRTAIVIAHRFSTIRAADRILVLNEGRLVEDGTHEELIRKNGYYSELFGDQFALAEGQS